MSQWLRAAALAAFVCHLEEEEQRSSSSQSFPSLG